MNPGAYQMWEEWWNTEKLVTYIDRVSSFHYWLNTIFLISLWISWRVVLSTEQLLWLVPSHLYVTGFPYEMSYEKIGFCRYILHGTVQSGGNIKINATTFYVEKGINKVSLLLNIFMLQLKHVLYKNRKQIIWEGWKCRESLC